MRCFVIRGFGKKKDSAGQVIDFDAVDSDLIAPALAQCGIAGSTTAEVIDAGSIHDDMFRLILQADLVLCDITVHNANVFYELGVRHALRKKHTVLIKGRPSADTTPFDITGGRYLSYPVANPNAALGELVAAIEATRASDRITDSPVFLMMPQLPEADLSSIALMPLDFMEEVQLAAARGDKGWLRLLAQDVRGERFEWEGLKIIGQAQWALNDFKAAIDTWETVRLANEWDLNSNLALANLYERMYKQTGDGAQLERSNIAIQRVLKRVNLSLTHRSEALALKGRNLKTLWRLQFKDLSTIEQRREKAIDDRAKQSYAAYREAYRTDLNNFFAGVAAYQMGRILQSLAKDPRFQNLFGGDKKKIARYVEDLEVDILSLEHVVTASIDRALTVSEGEILAWARVSAADMLFLTKAGDALEGDPTLVVDAYRNAVTRGRFYWDAARGQLELFEQLGISATTAHAVMKDLDGPPPAVGHASKSHLVIFSGHTVDRVGAEKSSIPRFPSTAQAHARNLIDAALQRMKGEGEQLIVLASAAPGADILALEACKALSIETWLCLPMERNIVASEVFSQYEDSWRNRFFALVDSQPPSRTFVMNDTSSLPRWLNARQMTPWSRGNRWMMLQAQSWGADRVTLLALWDFNEADLSKDGTAEMVRLARRAGAFVDLIDCRPLATILTMDPSAQSSLNV